MPNSIDFCKRVFLHVIPVGIIVPCIHGIQKWMEHWAPISRNFHEKATKVNINKVVSPANLPKQTYDQKTVFIIYFKTFADITKILD